MFDTENEKKRVSVRTCISEIGSRNTLNADIQFNERIFTKIKNVNAMVDLNWKSLSYFISLLN